MVKLLLGLDAPPAPHDVADALAVAICHLQASSGGIAAAVRAAPASKTARSWRAYRPS
jgi:Holliday junction resolvasome RuvABC endonuclease subunit